MDPDLQYVQTHWKRGFTPPAEGILAAFKTLVRTAIPALDGGNPS